MRYLQNTCNTPLTKRIISSRRLCRRIRQLCALVFTSTRPQFAYSRLEEDGKSQRRTVAVGLQLSMNHRHHESCTSLKVSLASPFGNKAQGVPARLSIASSGSRRNSASQPVH
ncbi:hypothetical protein MTO96_021532 [Rhipicephalus appendiculatus]